MVLQKGPGPLHALPVNNEGVFKRLGISVIVKDGKLELEDDFEACTKGKPITSTQSKVLKMVGVKIAEFEVDVIAFWNKTKGEFHTLKK